MGLVLAKIQWSIQGRNELTIVDVAAAAIHRASIESAEELAPFRTWGELTEPCRDYWRHLAQAAIDAILGEVTRD